MVPERDHCDPYGFQMELRPGTASIVTAASRYHFSDEKWMQQQNKGFDGPMNIYEVHLGSWKRKEDGSWYSYEELAPVLAEYAKENGYNYIELMPMSEHPADCSWGYQNTGFLRPPAGMERPTVCENWWIPATRWGWGFCWILYLCILLWTITV